MIKNNDLKNDLIAFSQTRWGFVYQRTQQLLSRYAKQRRIFFIEEPILAETNQISYRKVFAENGIEVIKPILSQDLSALEMAEALKHVIDDLIENEFIVNFSVWYDSPKAIEYTRHLSPMSTIYDCIAASSPQKPEELSVHEIELLEKADLVFTAHQNLYGLRKNCHHNIHCFPNSVDLSHFRQARHLKEPLDQQKIVGPKLGFYGDINDQINFDMLTDMADFHPGWNFILIGSIADNCINDLPHRSNIHFLGKKEYKYLPNYFYGWDVTIAPYKEGKHGHSTAQMYEYLATGRPVVATPHELLLKDEDEYEALGLVKIATTATCFSTACEEAMKTKHDTEWLKKVDEYLDTKSWDQTFENMKELELKTLISSLPYRRSRFTVDSILHM